MRNSRKISDAENRIRVLFSLRELGMATPEQLWALVSQLQGMEYLSFCLILNEQKESGDISEGSYALSKMLYLTAKGTETLRLFEKRMALTDRKRIRESAREYSAALNEKRRANIVYESTLGSSFCLKATVSEADEPLLEMYMTTSDAAFAEGAVSRFREAVPGLILLLCSFLTREEEGTPTDGSICRTQDGSGCVASLQSRDDTAEYRFSFRLPDEKAANLWLCGATHEPLAPKVTALLGGQA